MKKRTRLWLWLPVSFLTFTVIVPQLVLSLWGADLAGRVLTGTLEKRVTIQRVSGGWWWGLQIDELRIFDDMQDGAKTLLALGRLDLGTPLWMLIVPGGALDLIVDEVRVELRRLPDGAWNVAALQRDSVRNAPERFDLPEKRLRFELTRGRVYLEPEDLTYSLTAKAETPSLASQPLEWNLELSGGDGASLSAKGALAKLETPHEITGTARVEMERLDLGIVPPLVPNLPVMYPDGMIEKGDVRLDLQGVAQLHVRADLDLRDISLPDTGRESEGRLSRGSIRFALERDRARWTFDTLSLEGPDGSLSVAPGGWFELGRETWRGKLDFRGDLRDTEPASRALAMLIPDAVKLKGALHIDASVDGALSLDEQKTWPERLADLEAKFTLSLAQAQWQQERLEDIAARAALDNGRLSVPKVEASIGKGRVSLQGELAIGDRPGGSLTWLVTDVSLANLLAPDVRALDVTKASGTLAFEDGAYRLQSEAIVRALAFDRKALDDRELRLDNANLQCTGAVPRTLSRLDVTRCRLKAAQAEILSEQGRLDFGGKDPTLELEVNGWLSGPFLNALIPEIAVQWPAKVHLRGPLTVPLSGETWPHTKWRLDATGKDFGYANLAFTELKARVTKSVDRLNFTASGARGAGKVEADGAVELGAGTATIELKADRVPIQREIQEGYRLAAVVFGSGKVTIDASGENFALQSRLEGVTFRRGKEVISRLRSGTLEGEFDRARRGGLRARQLTLTADQLSVRLRDSHFPLARESREPLKLNLDFSGDGAWIALAAGMLGGVNRLTAEGPSELSLSLRGEPHRLPASMQGSGRLKLAQLTLWGQSLSNVDLAVDLQPNAVSIKSGEMRYNGGRLTLGGNVVLPIFEATRRQQLTVGLNQVPMRHFQALAEFEGKPARLVTETDIDGQIRFQRDPGGPLTVEAQLRSDAISRRIERQRDRVQAIQLPPLEGSLRLTATDSLERWTVERCTVRGRGAVIALGEGTLTLQDSLYALAAVATVELSPEFVEGLTLGLPQATFDPNGSFKASGRVLFRIPVTRPWAPADVDFDGVVALEELELDADTLSTLRLTLRLADGRLDVRNGEASLLGGRVWLPSPSTVNLQGPAHAFDVHVAAEDLKLRTYAGRKVSLGSFLALLVPVFVFTPDSGADEVRLSGVLRFDLRLAGTYGEEAGWTRSVNGDGSFRIENATVAGSTLVTGILAKSLLMPTNIVNNTIAALFSKDGQIGRELADLSDNAFRFRTIESPIRITNGEISLAKNLKLTSPEMELTLNGHSRLNGEVDYVVDTDLIKRIRFGKVTDLPNKIPVIGRALSFINPFSYLDGIELQARITGNVLQRGPGGGSNVQVHTSVVNIKAG